MWQKPQKTGTFFKLNYLQRWKRSRSKCRRSSPLCKTLIWILQSMIHLITKPSGLKQTFLDKFYMYFYIRRYLDVLGHSIITFTLNGGMGGFTHFILSILYTRYLKLKSLPSPPTTTPTTLHVLQNCGRTVEVLAWFNCATKLWVKTISQRSFEI